MGDMLDDGGLFDILVKLLLQFTDVGAFEASVFARWGMTKWAQNQPRCFSDNGYDPPEALSAWPFFTPKEFLNIIRPAFHKSFTTTTMNALMKRTAFLVFGPDWVAWRPYGKHQNDIKRKSLPIGYELLTAEGCNLYGRWRDGERPMPHNFDDWVPCWVAPFRKHILLETNGIILRANNDCYLKLSMYIDDFSLELTPGHSMIVCYISVSMQSCSIAP